MTPEAREAFMDIMSASERGGGYGPHHNWLAQKWASGAPPTVTIYWCGCILATHDYGCNVWVIRKPESTPFPHEVEYILSVLTRHERQCVVCPAGDFFWDTLLSGYTKAVTMRLLGEKA